MAKPDEPLLDLATLTERPRIIIDEKMYEIAAPDELPIAALHRLGSRGRRLDALMERDEVTAEEERELSALVVAISDAVMVGVPDDVRAKLSESQRLEVAQVFFALRLRRQRTADPKAAETTEGRDEAPDQVRGDPLRGSTGAKPSPGSSGSTEGTPGAGSTASPPQSSGPASP